MDVYSSLIRQMSDARTDELRRQAERHALARAFRMQRPPAARARFRGWMDRRRAESGPGVPVTPVVPVAPVAPVLLAPAGGDGEELRRSA
jgi:hypothetical protein